MAEPETVRSLAGPRQTPTRMPGDRSDGLSMMMKSIPTICALLLAVPLLGSAVNHFLEFARPPIDGNAGLELMNALRENGLMDWIILAHAVTGTLLVLPRTRFVAGLVQLPISCGIVAFNVTLYPPGIPLAIVMLLLNLGVLRGDERVDVLFQVPRTAG